MDELAILARLGSETQIKTDQLANKNSGIIPKNLTRLPGVLASLALPVFQAWGEVGMEGWQKLFGFELEPIEKDADQVLAPHHNP